jgi:hypothetical protein
MMRTQHGLIEGFTGKPQRPIHRQNPEMIDYARRTARDPSTPRTSLGMTEGVKRNAAERG